MLKLKNVNKYYNTNDIVTAALKNVNLELYKNEIVAIVGESGSGKTTLLNVICGVDSYDEGEIYFKGNETSYFNQEDMDAYRKNNVSFIYQEYNIIESYTVLENVMLPLLLEGYNEEDAKEEALKILDKVGLTSRKNHRGMKLSGGEKQRCVIARALASKCEILACDEPTGNLDSKTGAQIIELIKEISKDKLVLIVTHNYEQVKDICTRTIKVHDGEIVEDYSKQNELEDTTGDMILSKEKCDLKVLFRIGFKNLFNRINTSLLSFFILFTLSFVTLFLLITIISWNDSNKYTANPYYKNTIHNRLVVYNKDHSKIDLDDFNENMGNYYINPFFEDVELKVDLWDKDKKYMSTFSDVFVGSFTYELPKSMTLSYGELPSKENDCFMVFPERLQGKYIDELVDNIGDYMRIRDYQLLLDIYLCGYGYSSEIDTILFYTYEDFSKPLSRTYIQNLEVWTYIDNEQVPVPYNISIRDIDKPVVYFTGPNSEVLNTVYILYKDIYMVDIEPTEYKLVYYFSNEISISIDIPKDFEIDEPYEVSIYANNPDKVARKLRAKGYIVIQPGKNGVILTSEDNLSLIIFVAIAIVGILILLFIGYIVLSRLYINKKTDYNILRSLGYTKGDLSKIVHIEILSMTSAAIITSLVSQYILGMVFDIFKVIITHNSVFSTLLYIVIMLLLAFIISRRFNNKIFKFSVRKTFSSEVL